MDVPASRIGAFADTHPADHLGVCPATSPKSMTCQDMMPCFGDMKCVVRYDVHVDLSEIEAAQGFFGPAYCGTDNAGGGIRCVDPTKSTSAIYFSSDGAVFSPSDIRWAPSGSSLGYFSPHYAMYEPFEITIGVHLDEWHRFNKYWYIFAHQVDDDCTHGIFTNAYYGLHTAVNADDSSTLVYQLPETAPSSHRFQYYKISVKDGFGMLYRSLEPGRFNHDNAVLLHTAKIPLHRLHKPFIISMGSNGKNSPTVTARDFHAVGNFTSCNARGEEAFEFNAYDTVCA